MTINFPSPQSVIKSRAADIAISIFLALAWVFFALKHIQAFQVTGNKVYIAFCVLSSLQAFFFMIRSRAVTVSADPVDWAIAGGATFFPLFFRPANFALAALAGYLVYAALVLEFLSVLSLNRSFGIVPAKRVIKTSGLYRLVRHPMYAGHLLGFAGYVLTNSSPRNLIIFLAISSLMVMRMYTEESHLKADPDYQAYMQKVRWRLIPFVF